MDKIHKKMYNYSFLKTLSLFVCVCILLCPTYNLNVVNVCTVLPLNPVFINCIIINKGIIVPYCNLLCPINKDTSPRFHRKGLRQVPD